MQDKAALTLNTWRPLDQKERVSEERLTKTIYQITPCNSESILLEAGTYVIANVTERHFAAWHMCPNHTCRLHIVIHIAYVSYRIKH